MLGTASIKVAANWVVSARARWDLEADKLNQYIVGAGYVDDCFVLGLNYITVLHLLSRHDAAGTQPRVHVADRPAHDWPVVRCGQAARALQLNADVQPCSWTKPVALRHRIG